MSTAGSRVLVVEDQADVRCLLTTTLESEGYRAESASDGMQAFERLEANPPDLVILDVMMPVVSGLEVLDHIRQKCGSIPVILLTSLGAEENRVRGLRMGADDYMVKPFSPRELMARVDAVLRRSSASGRSAASTVVHGKVRLDLAARSVTVDGVAVELTAREFDLVAFLAERPGKVFTRPQLLHEVWQSSAAWQQASTVTEHVHRVRGKIGNQPDGSPWIATVRGVGYRFERLHAGAA
jgi:DNA-binding response OmpR family regulator